MRPISSEFARTLDWMKDCSYASWSLRSMAPFRSKVWESAFLWSLRSHKSCRRMDSPPWLSSVLRMFQEKKAEASTQRSQSNWPKPPSLIPSQRISPSSNDHVWKKWLFSNISTKVCLPHSIVFKNLQEHFIFHRLQIHQYLIQQCFQANSLQRKILKTYTAKHHPAVFSFSSFFEFSTSIWR